VAQPSAVRLRWTQRCVRGAGASSGCYVDVARASTGAVCDMDKLPQRPDGTHRSARPRARLDPPRVRNLCQDPRASIGGRQRISGRKTQLLNHHTLHRRTDLVCCTGTAAVTTGSVVARLSFAPDGAHASHSHRQYDYGGRRGAREARERALGVMLTWRGQARAPSATRISCRRTPRWYAPISTPTDVTRPVAGRGPSLGPPSTNRWAPADQRTENIAAAEG
jgi:hypothetical protein